MEYVIEKNVPMPEARLGTKGPTWGRSAAIRGMNIGDSILIPLNGKSQMSVQNSLGATTRTINSRDGTKKKFSTRRTSDGVRIWRIE